MADEKIDPIIRNVSEKTAELCDPIQIFLVSEKHNSKGILTAFKLCIIVSDEPDVRETESDLLINIDSPVPCDFIVYNISDWNEFVGDDCTFAYRIDNAGVLLYEQK